MGRDAAKPIFSIITPSAGKRPQALARAVQSVVRAADFADLSEGAVEMLVGFDGVRGHRPKAPAWVRFFDFPKDNDWGNGIRDYLLKASRGERVLFLDDDNTYKETALAVHLRHLDHEMVIARIDTQLAFDKPHLPEVEEGREVVRPNNIDPLCVCCSRELVVDRCSGWAVKGRYEADYLNILQYHRRARSVKLVEDLVGVYDMGRGLDRGGLNFRQTAFLDDRQAKRAGAHGLAEAMGA